VGVGQVSFQAYGFKRIRITIIQSFSAFAPGAPTLPFLFKG
jgi:hypothetical protein